MNVIPKLRKKLRHLIKQKEGVKAIVVNQE